MAWDSVEALVDVHAHFLTDRYVAAARAAGHEKPDGMPGWPVWSADEHLRLMDQWNIEMAFLSISSPGVHFGDDAAARVLAQHVNDAGAGLRRDHPDRYRHFASLPLPDVEGSLAELSRALDDLGSDGVAVETNTAGAYLGDERYEPLYAELALRQAVVFVHPTSPPCAEQVALGRPRPMMEFLFDTTRAATDLLFSGVFARHPQIRWVFTHGGGALPLLADRLELFRAVLVGRGGATVQELVSQLWFDMAGTPFPNQVPAVARAFGTGRLLYGSDYCWTPSPGITTQVASLDTAGQPENDTWRTLTSRNASRLFARAR
jgi:6-methylsalicylate decarboxylase